MVEYSIDNVKVETYRPEREDFVFKKVKLVNNIKQLIGKLKNRKFLRIKLLVDSITHGLAVRVFVKKESLLYKDFRVIRTGFVG